MQERIQIQKRQMPTNQQNKMRIQKYQKRGKEEKDISNCNYIACNFGFNISSNRNRRRFHNSSIIGSARMENLSHNHPHNHCVFNNFF